MTVRELAQLAGVSPATVSIVLNGKKGVSDKTRKSVLELAEKYEYVHTRTKSIQNDDKNIVLFLKFRKHGMLVEENQGFISAVMDSVEERCRARNYRLSIIQVDIFEKEELEKIDFDLYVGVIVLGTEIVENKFNILKSIPIPYVVVDNNMRNWPCNCVGINNDENVYLALQYFKEHGYKEIAYFSSNDQIENFRERKKAFMEYSKEFGLEVRREFPLTPTLVGAYNDMEHFMEHKVKIPECIFSDNDTIAIGAIKCLRKKGYKIPDDVSVIGFDDIPFAAINFPSLSTIRVPKELIGKKAVDLLFDSIEDSAVRNVKIQIVGSLVIRSSVKKA